MQQLCVAFASLLVISIVACQAPSAPVESAATQAASMAPKATPPSGKQAAVHASPSGPAAATSTGGVPTGVMPNDSVHAPFKTKAAPQGGVPVGHPPVGATTGPKSRPSGSAQSAEQGVALPLPLQGSGSITELKGRLEGIDGPTRDAIEQAFRLTFTVNRAKRDPAKAKSLLTPLLDNPQTAAIAHRTLGYVAVSQGFDVVSAMKHYGAAAKLAPEYGEVHYALAFMYARDDLATGKIHFEKAMKLGVPDIRGIARFYPDAAK